jgi:hypothetical protein
VVVMVMVMGMLFTQPNAMIDNVQLEPRGMMDDWQGRARMLMRARVIPAGAAGRSAEDHCGGVAFWSLQSCYWHG